MEPGKIVAARTLLMSSIAEPSLCFPLNDQAGLEAVISCLSALGEIRRGEQSRHACIMKDSFDWRLYRSGHVVEECRHGTATHTVLRQFHSGDVVADIAAAMPQFPGDCPAGRLRDWLTSRLKMRALMPVLRIQSCVQRLSLLNRDKKTVLRLRVEQHLVAEPAGEEEIALGCFLRLDPVRGYGKYCKRAHKLLQKDIALAPPLQHTLYDLALATVGRQGMDYTSKMLVTLDAAMPAQQAVRCILQTLWNTMKVNMAGMVADIDTEFLHDYRISVRRTRSALAQIKGVFPAREQAYFCKEFAWLGGITTPVRDLDAYLLDFNSYQEALPCCMRPDLEALRTFLITKRTRSLKLLVRRLHSVRHQHFQQDWQAFIQADDWPPEHLPTTANHTIRSVANRNILRVARRVLREGGAIEPESPEQSLHDLRKTCKKLRYLIEFFGSLYCKHDLAGLITNLKQLQDHLGQFQDMSVQREAMLGIRAEMQASGYLPAVTERAMEVLMEVMFVRQQQSREVFASSFKHFARSKNRQRIKQLFGGKHA